MLDYLRTVPKGRRSGFARSEVGGPAVAAKRLQAGERSMQGCTSDNRWDGAPAAVTGVWSGEFAWMMGAALLAVALALIPVARNPLFYFRDDFQVQFMPMFGEIARLLKSGEFPLATDRIWFGGAILGEYQFAVLNPVSLAAYLVIDGVGQLHHAATIFVVIHIAILAAGLYLLAREYDADRPASLLAGVIGSTGGWLIYWADLSWVPALVSAAWFPWAAWALLRAYRNPRWMIPAALLTYMVLASGWPQGDVALAVSSVIMLSILFHKDRRIIPCLRIIVALGSALLLASPALFPLLAYLRAGDRVHLVQGSLWRASLDAAVTALGVPLFPSVLRTWTDYRMVTAPPIYYLAWFAPIVIANALTRRSSWRSSTGRTILWFSAGAFLFLSVAPNLWEIRFPFRFLPYFHIFVALLVALFLTKRPQSEGAQIWRLGPTCLAVFVPFFLAYANAPREWAFQAAFALFITSLSLIVIWLQKQDRSEWCTFLLVGHATLFLAVTTIASSNEMVSSWRLPAARPETDGGTSGNTRTFALYPPMPATDHRFGGSGKVPGDYWVTIAPAGTALYGQRQTINGYSPFLQHGFIRTFCFTEKGATCPKGPSKLLANDPLTSLSYLDLMAVDRVVAMRGPYADMFAKQAGREWTMTRQTGLADIFERKTPQRRVGNIVQWPDGTRVRNPHVSVRSESYDVAVGQKGGRIVVARAWYPGVRARLDGKAVPVEPVGGLVPSVILPAGAHGRLVIEYWPAGLTAGLYAALVGAVVLFAAGIALPVMHKRAALSSIGD